MHVQTEPWWGRSPALCEESRESGLRIGHHGRDDVARVRLERLVHETFARCHSADVTEFAPDLLAFWRAAVPVAVAGLRCAAREQLFSERYLDAPLEAVLACGLGHPVARHDVCEIGNLAVLTGEARAVYAMLAAFLHGAGFRWLVCTAITPLYHRLRRAGFGPIALATAAAARLGPRARQWGSYYSAGALVCCGDVEAAYRALVARDAGCGSAIAAAVTAGAQCRAVLGTAGDTRCRT